MVRDLIVIGGGAAGLAAARTAASRGAHPLLVSHGPLGGECTFTGCVPSKTMIEAAHRSASFEDAQAAIRQAIATIAATEDDTALGKGGVDVAHGWARFSAPGALEIDGVAERSNRIVIATGSHPAVPAIEGLASVEYLTNENVFDLPRQPGRLAVLGGGAVGCELAQAFARLGTTVAVIEAEARLLPNEEPKTSALLAERFARDGIAVHAGRAVVRVSAAGDGGACRLFLEAGGVIDADRVLVATGRRPATEGLDLGAAGVETDDGWVRTDDHLATTARGVWAAGDVTGRMMFTHAAYEMGRIAATNATRRARKVRFDTATIPWVTFTDPEIARVGLTEAQAARPGVLVAELPMSEVDRAIAASDTGGFVKLIAGPRPALRGLGGGRLLGATVVAPRAGEMIHEAALAMRAGMFVGRLAQTVHAYPTWSMAIQQAAAQFFVEIGGRRARPAYTDEAAAIRSSTGGRSAGWIERKA